MQAPYQLIYLSSLDVETSPGCVAEIVRAARLKNERLQIKSLIVFDGWRFCQYLEGNQAVVSGLFERICADPRHTDVRLLFKSDFTEPGRLATRNLSYALCYDHSLDQIESQRGVEAVGKLKGLLPTFDLEP
ncbi:MAG: BLUF domain-containing protein [Polaromonas sp.]